MRDAATHGEDEREITHGYGSRATSATIPQVQHSVRYAIGTFRTAVGA